MVVRHAMPRVSAHKRDRRGCKSMHFNEWKTVGVSKILRPDFVKRGSKGAVRVRHKTTDADMVIPFAEIVLEPRYVRTKMPYRERRQAEGFKILLVVPRCLWVVDDIQVGIYFNFVFMLKNVLCIALPVGQIVWIIQPVKIVVFTVF